MLTLLCSLLCTTQPNILLIMVDDLGWRDTSVRNGPPEDPTQAQLHTPHIQRLADEGMRLDHAYASGCVCTPTRASLLTGAAPARHHITWWTLYHDRDTSGKHPTLRAPDWKKEGVQPSPDLLPERLRRAGYRTIHVGKAHWGAHGTPGSDPLQLGFDKNIAGHGSGAPGSYRGIHRFKNAKSTTDFSKSSVWDVPGLEAYHDRDLFLTEALTIEASRSMEAAVASGEPFFLHFAPYAVHTPIMANPRWIDETEGLAPVEARYVSLVRSVDAAVGVLLERLDALGISNNTLVIFTSDNGAVSGYAGRPANRNAPLRGSKSSPYEGGHRVPLIARWPQHIPAGASSNAMVVTHDLHPTLLRWVGLEAEERSVPDGLDISSILLGQKDQLERFIVWHKPHRTGGQSGRFMPCTAIRMGDEKLIAWHAEQRFELYDLQTDPGEQNDLSGTHPERVDALSQVLADWCREAGAQMSVDQERGEPVPWFDAW